MSDTSSLRSAVDRSEPKLGRRAKLVPDRESAVWEPVQSGSRQLYGGFAEVGGSIQWHDFQLATAFAWSRSFHPESLELCLNLAGQGSVRHLDQTVEYEPLTADQEQLIEINHETSTPNLDRNIRGWTLPERSARG